MSKLKLKLKENQDRRSRELLLSCLPEQMGTFLEEVEFTSDVNCIKYAAFSTWDHEADIQTTTRGKVDGWVSYDFKYWGELFNSINLLPTIDCEGWLFFETEGPYFKIKLTDLLSHLDSIQMYTLENDKLEFGWVGSDQDCGLIAEFNHTTFCRNTFELSVWGI